MKVGILERERERRLLCGESLVVHKKELDVLDVADEEGLVARGHHVAGALVGAIANLEDQPRSATSLCHVDSYHLFTWGMGAVPLNRRRIRLSIPLGFRQLESTEERPNCQHWFV